MSLESVEDDEFTSIVIRSQGSIDKALEIIIRFLQSTQRYLIYHTHVDGSMVDSYDGSTVVASCIVDEFLDITKSFFIYDLVKSFQIRHDRSRRLDIGKSRYHIWTDSIVTECHS